MATWRKVTAVASPDLAWWDPEVHGPGIRGIRAWSTAARAWLAANPGRRLPCGDTLDVYRATVRLILDNEGQAGAATGVMMIGAIGNICGYCGQPEGEHLRMCPVLGNANASPSVPPSALEQVEDYEKKLGQAT